MGVPTFTINTLPFTEETLAQRLRGRGRARIQSARTSHGPELLGPPRSEAFTLGSSSTD